MRALVTGGSGFVGANLTRRLLREGHDVSLLLRSEADPWRLADVRTAVRVCQGDVADGEAVQRAVVASKADWVFHLAAHGAYSNQTDSMAMVRTNVLGALQVIAAASRGGCQALVLAGSSAEYGLCETPPTEDQPVAPTCDYGATKAAATSLALLAAAQPSAVPIVVLRLYSIYGPWEDPQRLLPTLLSRAAHGGWPPLASRDTTRDFLFVNDASQAMLTAARAATRHRGALFNVGSGVGTTLEELTTVVADMFGLSPPARFGEHPGRAWDSRMSWISNPGRIHATLGWKATTPLRSGLAAFASWLGEHGALYGNASTPVAPKRAAC